MRLRATVTQLWHDSSEEDEDAVSADAVWQPGSHEGSDAEDTGRADAPAPAAARDAAPRRLSHADLTQALLDMPAAHDTPAAAAPEALTQEWALGGGFSAPTLVASAPGVAAALGMRLPPELDADTSMTAVQILPSFLQLLPPDTPVPVIDVATQAESAPVSLADFVSYFTAERRERLLNVVSLSLAGTPLEATLCAPKVVREADLVARAWPAARRDCPAVQLYALASPAGCFTDWHLDFGGSSVWYRIVAGSKVFALAPPTTHNLRAYVQWASSSRQSREFLGDAMEDVHKYTVRAGELLLIPGGWPHAVVTPEDSVVVGGNFVHAANLGLQCMVWRIEDRLRVEASYRYPNFKALCWYAAHAFCQTLPAAADEEEAVARAERGGSKRLCIKLRDTDAAGAGAADEQAGEREPHGLDFILSALKAEEEASVAKSADAADEPAGSKPEEQLDAGGAEAEAALAAIAIAGVPVSALTSLETTELAKLCAQLSVWLELGRDDELQAGVPADVGKPRALLARLQSRLRAAGVAVQPLADAFDAEAEEIVCGSTRLRFRLRKRTVVDHGDDAGAVPAAAIPAELRDDAPAARKAERAAERADRATAGAAAAAAKAAPKRATGSGVRDRLAKKLKINARR